jgi:hypothetical protein
MNGKLVGVVKVGRPVARRVDDGRTLEVLRLCTDGTKDVCSFLYSRAARIGKEMGYEFTSDDIKKAESKLAKLAAGTEELSGDRTRLDMDNLESVAGGVLPIDGCCFGGNHDWKLVGKEKGFAWGNNLHYQCRICFDKASEWEKYPWEDFIDWITE